MDFSSWEIKFYELIDKLPFDPALYHPHVVHFAVALPLTAFLFQWFSLASPDKGYQGSSNLLFYLGITAIVFAFITGKAAAPDIKPTLTIAGQDIFDTHKEVGTYITLAFMMLLPIKMFSSSLKSEITKNMVMIFMVITLIGLYYEISSGHQLVYDYAAGTQMQYAKWHNIFTIFSYSL